VEERQFRKAIQTLALEGLATTSPEVIEERLAKHPQSPHSAIPPLQCPPAPYFSVELVLKALKSLWVAKLLVLPTLVPPTSRRPFYATRLFVLPKLFGLSLEL